MRIVVLGGSGFVGHALLRRLSARGHELTVLVRRIERHRDLQLLPGVTLVEERRLSELHLRQHLAGQDALINLIGILHASSDAPFDQVHVGLARKLVAACEAEGVERVLHMSALGAAVDAPSEYLRSKGEAEDVMHASALKVTSFRPSVIFGEGDHLLSGFARMLSALPVMAVPCPKAQVTPIWVEDVAEAFVRALDMPQAVGQRYDLCGTRVYTLHELVQLVAEFSGSSARILPLNARLSRWVARVFEWLPGRVFSRDNYLSLQVPSVCAQPPAPVLPAPLRSLRSFAYQVLAPRRTRARFMTMRQVAGRNQSDL